jgi:hypothetical protein
VPVASGQSGVSSLAGLYHYGTNAASWGADVDMMYLWASPTRLMTFPTDLTITPSATAWFAPHLFGAPGVLRRLKARLNLSGGAQASVSIFANLSTTGKLWPAERLWTSGAVAANGTPTFTPELAVTKGSVLWLAFNWNGVGAFSTAGIAKDWFAVGGQSVLAGWRFDWLDNEDTSPLVGWKIPMAFPSDAVASQNAAGIQPIQIPSRYAGNTTTLPTAAFAFEASA